MPLADTASAAVLSTLTPGTWTALNAIPTPVEHGFDALDVLWVCDFTSTPQTALQIAAAFPLGTRYGSADFWLRSGTPACLGGNVWTFKAHYEGRISSGKAMSVRMQSTQEVYSVASLTLSPLFTNAPVNVRECSPSVELGYVLVNAEPPTALVGLSGSPAVSPGVRAGIWGYLTDPRFNYPAGWVFTDCDADFIAGSSPHAYYVKESWQYFQQQVPA